MKVFGNNNENKLIKGIRQDGIFVLIIGAVMGILTLMSLWRIVDYSHRSESAFEMQTKTTAAGDEYGLLVNGVYEMAVDYNDYLQMSENAKVTAIAETAEYMVNALLLGTIFLLLHFVIRNFVKQKTPFVKQNIILMRGIAVLTILSAMLPGISKAMLSLALLESGTIHFSIMNFWLLMLGVALGVIAEIFRYGYSLQEEMNQIA